MYQQSQFDPALLSLMSVAKKVTPQGQPTVAAGIMQQAGVPPQAMQPGSPQGMMPPPPQGMPPPQQGLPGVLQQTQQAAPSVAQNMQEQQTAQMLAQAQPQPPMMAEGGIASLPVDDYEYADGGIIGYAGGGGIPVGEATERFLSPEAKAYLEEMEKRKAADALRAAKNVGEGSAKRSMLMRLLQGLGVPAAVGGVGGALSEYATNQLSDNPEMQEAMQGDVGSDAALAGAILSQSRSRQDSSALAEEAPVGSELPGGIKTPNAAASASASYDFPVRSYMGAAPLQAATPKALPRRPEGIEQALPRQAPAGAEAMYLEQLQAIRDQRSNMREPRSLDQIRQEELAARRARGLPEDPNAMAFKHLEETAALQQKIRDAQLAKEGPERQDALLKGILAPGAMNLGQLFGNSAREIMGAEATQRGNVEARAKEDLVRKQAEQAIRAAIQKANYAELDGDMATAQAERTKAETIQQALFASQQTLTTGRRGEVASDERSARDRLARLTELSRPGETERMMAEYQRILATDPAAAEKYLKTAESIKGLGRGLDIRENSVELRALKDEEAQLLKRLENTFGSERVPIISRLDQLSKDRVKLMGGTAPVSQQLPAQVLSQLKEGVVTTFKNGQQWTLQGGQPKQVN